MTVNDGILIGADMTAIMHVVLCRHAISLPRVVDCMQKQQQYVCMQMMLHWQTCVFVMTLPLCPMSEMAMQHAAPEP